jgi:H+-translocating NAD(P) transhydrogenase subunit alpha
MAREFEGTQEKRLADVKALVRIRTIRWLTDPFLGVDLPIWPADCHWRKALQRRQIWMTVALTAFFFAASASAFVRPLLAADSPPSHSASEAAGASPQGGPPQRPRAAPETAGAAADWYVFMLSTIIGLGVVGRVSRLLHTPLMSLTNAISAIAVVGSIAVAGSDYPPPIRFLGAVALFASMTNIVSGFLITDRMLKMFRQTRPPEPPPSPTQVAPAKTA